MPRHRALIIPVICPLDGYAIGYTSIHHFSTFQEVKHAASHEQLLINWKHFEKPKKVSLGSFGILYHEGFEGHTIVFLNPYEVLVTLNAKVVIVTDEGVKVIDNDYIRKMNWKRTCSFLAHQWYSGNILIVSEFVAEAIVDGLRIHCEPNDPTSCYCYGRIRRVINKMDIDSVIKRSRAIALPHVVNDPLKKARMVLDVLMYYPPRWPWFNYGLVLDKSRKWITVLNPDVSHYIETDHILELRVIDYVENGYGNYVPVIVTRRLTLTQPGLEGVEAIFDVGNVGKHINKIYSRLSNALLRVLADFELSIGGSLW